MTEKNGLCIWVEIQERWISLTGTYTVIILGLEGFFFLSRPFWKQINNVGGLYNIIKGIECIASNGFVHKLYDSEVYSYTTTQLYVKLIQVNEGKGNLWLTSCCLTLTLTTWSSHKLGLMGVVIYQPEGYRLLIPELMEHKQLKNPGSYQ